MFVKERFVLNNYTVDLLKDMEPTFGYDGFGEFVFYRTYSRIAPDGHQENWADVVTRVINGCMSIRKDWYIKNGISWDEKWWQNYAKKMAIALFKMEWLPGGRGLWAMGTDFIYERGSMALNNCLSGETQYITDKGVVNFFETVSKSVNVLCVDNIYRPADVKSFGLQQLQLIKFRAVDSTEKSISVFATKDHGWLLNNGTKTHSLTREDVVNLYSGERYFVEKIIETSRYEEVFCVVEPVTHTFILADGLQSLNCGVTFIEDEFEKDLGWLMDALMLGVGVGYSPLRNDRMEWPKQSKDRYDFVIPDSREGWVESCERRINAIRFGTALPRMIYDEVRIAGLPIRGFGGISSGPEPLMELHEHIEMFMDWYMTDKYYDSVMLKADIANMMGVCTVAGNVRRSALLASLSIKDPTFKNLKCYEDPKYSYRQAWGWMANHALDLEDDEDFEQLTDIANRVIIRGEPGYKNLQNFKFGRISKRDKVRIDAARLCNPCIVGDTKVLVADGRGYIPIRDLEDQDVDVYSVDNFDRLIISRMRHVRITGYNQRIYKVVLDSGDSLRVTANHKFMLRSGQYVEAKDLKYGDQLSIVNRYIPTNTIGESYFDKYISIGYGGETYAEHRMIADFNFDEDIENQHVHHIDENRLNNHPSNLTIKGMEEHLSGHSIGENNARWNGYSNYDLVNMGIQLCNQLGRRFSVNEWSDKYFAIKFGNYRSELFKSFAEFASYCADQADVLNDRYDTRTLRHYQEMLDKGYQAEINEGVVLVNRVCEYCKNEFMIEAGRREQAFCSHTCNNYARDYTANAEGQIIAFKARREGLKQQQADVYTELKQSLCRRPLKREWKEECQNKGISFEMCRKGSPFQSWGELCMFAHEHNHRVVSVIEDGYEDVYTGTVDDFHNYISGGWEEETLGGRCRQVGVVQRQCGESLLENKELCNQAETLPTVCQEPRVWLKACEYATTYTSTISLLPTHRPETNKIVAKNRRITIGIIDFSGWKHEAGVSKVTKWMREGYIVVRSTNQHYNGEAGVPEAIRVTTIKPGGTTPKLPGKTPGIGHPTFEYIIRRANIAKNSPIMPLLIEAGVPYEDSVTDKYSYIIEWPIHQGPALPADKISLWEQAMNLVLVQREWADNAVSNTLYFRPRWVLQKSYDDLNDVKIYLGEKLNSQDAYISAIVKLESEYEETIIDEPRLKITFLNNEYKIYSYDPNHEEHNIEPVLAAIAPLTKTVSLLPHTPNGVYAQTPEEGITKEEYERRKEAIKAIDWSKLSGSDGSDERYCSGPQCELPINNNPEQ